MAKKLKERSQWDPRVSQWPVPVLAGVTSVWSSVHCAKEAFLIDPRKRIIPIALTAVGSAAVTLAFYQTKLMVSREKDWGTWRSCPQCEVANAACAGFVLAGLVPAVVGGLATSTSPRNERLWGKRSMGRTNVVGTVLDTFAFAPRGLGMATLVGAVALVLFSHKMDYDERMWKRSTRLREKEMEKEKEKETSS